MIFFPKEQRKYCMDAASVDYVIAFAASSHFVFHAFIPCSTSIEQYNIKGIEEFAKEMDEKGLGKPKVSLQFELSPSGITQLIKAEAAVEETVIVEEEEEVDDDEEEEETPEDKADETDEAKEEEKSSDETKAEESAEGDGADGDKTESEDTTNDTKAETPKKKKKKTIMVQKASAIQCT